MLVNRERPNQLILNILKKNNLIPDDEKVTFKSLKGGVSSNIWKVSRGEKAFCVKQPLLKLRVKAPWHAPLERNQFEAKWLQIANELIPGSAPRIIHSDEEKLFFAMEYLNPKTYKLWKSELSLGRGKPYDSGKIGKSLSMIHKYTAGNKKIYASFPKNNIFRAIRLEPYLETLITKYPDLGPKLKNLSKKTENTRLTLIHGDISPKNILIGPRGPVFLDAECACIGDPAFDLAFYLNHLLLKCLLNPDKTKNFLLGFKAMKNNYFSNVTWENKEVLEQRASSLLPALLLARIDGKSPVEYIELEKDKNKVRQFAKKYLLLKNIDLETICQSWEKVLNR